MKKSAALFLLALVSFKISALQFSLELAPFAGVKNGKQYEDVFIINGQEELLSQLKWEEAPLILYGMGARANAGVFFAEFSFKNAVHALCGSMTDNDWANRESIYILPEKLRNAKTHFSSHDNTLTDYFSFSGKAGLSLSPAPIYTVEPSVSFEFTDFSMSASGGYLNYGVEIYNTVYTPLEYGVTGIYSDTELITLHRQSYWLWTGVNNKFRLSDRFMLETGLFVSPFAFIRTYDNHILRKRMYKDEVSEFIAGFRATLGAEFFLTEHASIFINAAATHSRQLKGKYYTKSANSSSYIKIPGTKSGASECSFEFAAGCKLKISN